MIHDLVDCRLDLFLSREFGRLEYGIFDFALMTRPALLEFNSSSKEDIDIEISGLIDARVRDLNSVPNFLISTISIQPNSLT